MTINKAIVRDLLPVYLAGEASQDTRLAVEEWLRQDPELRETVDRARGLDLPPVVISPGLEKRSLMTTQSLLRRKSWLMGGAIFTSFLPASFVVVDSKMVFLMLRDQPVLAIIAWVLAALLWVLFFRTSRKLKVTLLS